MINLLTNCEGVFMNLFDFKQINHLMVVILLKYKCIVTFF